ncbi:hypothetical protein FRC14_004735 [Serendipita sp. 396]|nr:hypothetical protein FRC14_004735 [Serendipita sp. 396]KAG8789384.1 hypothetical protein FRC15_009436 [Serendipita sp. 397]KAG8804616.1 hypothetical protein FRC16_006058 [Serendipita sp. 398]KAG8824541.1 hypothetical protein FRC19_001565 [Serendipita sp. 401]KAG8829862.1 hypothetical protein FRC18_008929 [Serendipita sp. 400]KAG8851075.1 hypothetical protein FRB91_008499 [Serendipita sp. 411]KAG8878738.1 hypothetical protein FRC20_006415 [Serendipita sp. 405]KAG9055288.1 hypothetical prot
MPITLSSRDEFATLVENFDTFLFDCDGVLWNGDHLIDGVTTVLNMLRSKKKSVIFVTNNATKSRKDYKGKFDHLGVQAEVEEIFGSAYAAAVYISTVLQLPKSAKVYVIGMSGLEYELAQEGISYIGGSALEDNTLEPFKLESFQKDPSVKAVLCGLDTSINFTKLCKAFQYLQNGEEECKFLATNVDSTYPQKGGLLPGAGSLSASLSRALGREPLSIGKPGRTMLDCIKAKHQFDPSRTIMIGDRLDTDIAFGKNGGVSTLLVMTGVTTESILQGAPPSSLPDYIVTSLGDLQVLA